MSRLLRFALPCVLLVAAAASSPAASTSASSLVVLGGFPTLRQQHSLTCESSAASMGTRGVVSEARIMAALPRNSNPNLGFRGNADGEEAGALHDYGVYALPLQRSLMRLGYHSDVISYGYDATIKTYIRRGWPVVLWVTYQLKPSVPRLSESAGVQFMLVPHEHAILAVGYDNGTILANDPWTAQQVRYRWQDFNRSWGLFGNMALAIAPCHVPGAVTNLRVVAATTDQLSFSWKTAPNTASYSVKIVQRDQRDRTVFQGMVTSPNVSIPGPKAGGTYEISVQSRGSCGVTASTSRRLWVLLPPVLPASGTSTPTPSTPTPEQTVAVPSPTTTATAVPTATTSPSPSPRPHH